MNGKIISALAAAMLATFALAAVSCRRNDDATAPRGYAADEGPGIGMAGDPAASIENRDQAADASVAAEALGRFAGVFEFYGYEIVHIYNMESPLDAREMAGDRIVVEPGGDGLLRFSRIDARMADPDWLTFSGAGDPGWDSHLVLRLTSDGFAFSVGDGSGGSMEILNDGGHVNGLTGLFGMRLWYEDEDTIVYEESRWRGLLWDDDAAAIEYREITFRLVYRRIRTFAVPVTVAVCVNDREFSAPAWEVDGRHYFDIRDIAFMLAGTRAEFFITTNRHTRFDGPDGLGRSFTFVGEGPWLVHGFPHNPTGSEMSGEGRETQEAIVRRETGHVIGGMHIGHVTDRPLGTHAGLTVAYIDGRGYFCLLGFGAIRGKRVLRDEATGAITIETRVPTISERGLAAAREFLGQDRFRTIFEPRDQSWLDGRGAVDPETGVELPYTWIYTSYRLLDFDDGGVPGILVRSSANSIDFAGVIESLFVYTNGAYEWVADIRTWFGVSFWGTDQGRIYMIHHGHDSHERMYVIPLENGATRARHFASSWWSHARLAGETRTMMYDEFRAMVDAGDWEDARDDFPDLVAFLDGLDTLFRIQPLDLDVFAESP